MDKILVIDFGGQYAHLIARRFRNLGYYSEIASPTIETGMVKDVKGIVLSGGPSSVYDPDAPKFNRQLFSLDLPILGLCYGHHLMQQEYGGKVEKADTGEYGFAQLQKIKDSILLKNISFPTQVWMSHSDTLTAIPADFDVIGSTEHCQYAALENLKIKRFSLQFHAEVKDTPEGNTIFQNFAEFCQMDKNWDSNQVLSIIRERIKEEAGNKKILIFLSGGVDSSVAYTLLASTLGYDRILGLYINNGFMRKNESEAIQKRYQEAGFQNVIYENAADTFLEAVKQIIDPQQKRKNIGETFLKVRDRIIERLNLDENEWLLAQGTLYPDIIESGGSQHANVIKTHHNRVEGIKQLMEKGLIIEPLKELYKDEVRLIGKEMDLPDEIISRHPFPGPGISINCLCSNGRLSDPELFQDVTQQLKTVDLSGFIDKRSYNLSLLPVRSVGVQGDFRTYNFPAVLELENALHHSEDWEILDRISSFLTNKIRGINRVILKFFCNDNCALIEGYCTQDRLDMIRDVDDLMLTELKKTGWYNKIFQHLTINLPYSTHPNACSIVLRPVFSEDVMTARFARIDPDLLRGIITKIKQLNFVDGLYYDITNKPPATFGWE